MKPAVCGKCGKSPTLGVDGDWVSFSNYTTMTDEDIGHPEGLIWFCEHHLDEAKSLANLTYTDALK